MRIKIDGQNYSLTAGRSTPPQRGSYVAYKGMFYPVSTKTGYPLSIVADIAAKAQNKIVLVPGDEVHAFLSGTGRVINTGVSPAATSDDDRNEFSKALLRLTLLSSHKEVVALGRIPVLGETQHVQVNASDLNLPRLVVRSTTWVMVAVFTLIIGVSIAAASAVRSHTRSTADAAEEQTKATEKELDEVLALVTAGRGKLAEHAPSASAAASASTLDMPQPRMSYMDAFKASKNPTPTQIRVTDGSITF